MDSGFSGQPVPETAALRVAELVRLQKFAQRITSTLDLEELVPRIVDEVAASLGCVEIHLYLRAPEDPDFVLACVRGLRARYALRSRHSAATRGRSGRSVHRFPL